MRTSKNAWTWGGSSISRCCFAFSKSLSLSQLMVTLQISCWRKEKTGKKQGSGGEQRDEQSCREGKHINNTCILCHQSLTLSQIVMKQKLFHLPASFHGFYHGCFCTTMIISEIFQPKRMFTLARDSHCFILLLTPD